MPKVVGVRFPSSGRIYYFDPLNFEMKLGDGVIVETARGQEYGFIAQEVVEVEETMIVAPLKPIIRLATAQDTSMRAENVGKEDEAFAVCAKKIAEHKLDMKLVNVECSFNGSKVVFYFTADERVDFRELVKDLASHFRTRIELRQIGVRDEAKMLGGLGSCGRPVCCKTFLDDFRPVSIKMAKEQNLSLSPTKISGLCGRLMCCLQYEQAAYEDMKKKMPRVGKEVVTPDGTGTAVENNAITEKTRVRLTLPDGSIDVREYHYTELAKPGDPLPERHAPAENTEQPASSFAPASPASVKRRPKPSRVAQPKKTEPGKASPSDEKTVEEKSEPRKENRPRRSRGKRPQQNAAKPEGQDAAQKSKPTRQKQAAPKDAPNETEAKPAGNRRRRHRGGVRHRSGNAKTPDGNGGNAPKSDA